MSSPTRLADKDKVIQELEAKVDALKEENAALQRKVELYENFLKENGLHYDSREKGLLSDRRMLKKTSPESTSAESLTTDKRDRTAMRKVSRSFARIPSLNTVSLATPFETKEKEKLTCAVSKDLLNEPLFGVKESSSPNEMYDFEKIGKLTILGEKELRKDVLHALTGQATEGNVESIIRVKLAGTQTLLNVWAFELELQHTNSHQLFLSGTGVQIIACNLSGHSDIWKEETLKWLHLSKFHSRLFLPTLIVGYTDGRKKKKWNEKQMAAHFKKFKVSEVIVIENPKSYEKNSKLIVDGVNSLMAKFPTSFKKGPVFDKELIRSLLAIEYAFLNYFSGFVCFLFIVSRDLTV
jgi:hypothetical protein